MIRVRPRASSVIPRFSRSRTTRLTVARGGRHHCEFVLADSYPSVSVICDPELTEAQQLALYSFRRRREQQLDELSGQCPISFDQHSQKELVDDPTSTAEAEFSQIVTVQKPSGV